MRRTLYLIAVVALCSLRAHAAGCSSTAYSGFTCVSHAGSFTSSATTRNQTISVTAGDAVTFIGWVLATGSALTLTDSGACTGTLTGATNTVSMSGSVAVAAVTKATSTGTCTITMHWAGSSTTLISSVQDWQGWNGAVDVSGAITSTTGTGTRSCPAVTTTQNGDLVLCMMMDNGNNSGTYTAGTGFAITLGNNSTSQEAQVQSTAGAITPGFTYSQSSTFGVATFALESIAVPPPPTFTLSAINGIAPSSGTGGFNQWNGQYINPSTGFLGKVNGQATTFSAFPVQNFVNLSGGTNGGALGATDLATGTVGATATWNVTNLGASMTYSNGTTFGSLPEPVLTNGVAYNTSGPFTIHCTSATDALGTAHACGYTLMTFLSPGPSVSAGFWFTTPNCNGGGTQDCGAMGIVTNGTDYVNAHLNAGSGSGNCSENGIFLESHGGNSTDCVPFTNGATYRINGQQNTGHAALTVTFTNGSPVISATNSLAANQAIILTTTGALPTNFNLRLSTGSYTSGVSATGAVGTTCVLTSFNGGGSGAIGLVYLRSTNSLPSGDGISWVSRGSGYTSAPTSATASSGTATCSGTATISTVLATAPLFVSSTGLSGSQFELATAQGGTPISAGSAGSGTHTATQYDLLTVCQLSGSSLIYLGTMFGTADTTAQTANELQIGVSGEGPTTTGFDFYWGGATVDNTGKFSTTECVL